MNYQAVNLGWQDFIPGRDYLLDLSSITAFPLITSNLKYKNSGSTFGKKYVIKNIKGIRVGILGIMPENRLNHIIDKNLTDYLTVLPPEPTLAGLIPEVRQKADVVILLSQNGYNATSELLSKVSGIDLAIAGNNQPDELPKCGSKNLVPESYERVNNTLIMPARDKGRALGYIKIKLDKSDNSVIGMEPKEIPLTMDVKMDSELEKISGSDIYVTAMKEIKESVEKMRAKMEKEFKQLRSYSPEEYFEYVLSKQRNTKGIMNEKDGEDDRFPE